MRFKRLGLAELAEEGTAVEAAVALDLKDLLLPLDANQHRLAIDLVRNLGWLLSRWESENRNNQPRNVRKA